MKPFNCIFGKHDLIQIFTKEPYRICRLCNYTERQGYLSWYKIPRSGIIWSTQQLEIMNIDIWNKLEYHSTGLYQKNSYRQEKEYIDFKLINK